MNTKHYKEKEEELSNVVIHRETLTKNKKSLFVIFVLMRPWIFVFVFLFITEISLRIIMPGIMISNPQIKKCQTYHEFLQTLGAKHNISHFKLYLQIIDKKDHNAFKIYFLGDSIILGNAPFKRDIKEERDDIALSLENELQSKLPDKNIKVYNLATLGAGEYANYEMIQVLAKFKPKFIIKNVNFRNFNDFINNPQTESRSQKQVKTTFNLKIQLIKSAFADEINPARFNSPRKVDIIISLWNTFARRSITQMAGIVGEITENFLYKNFMLYRSRDYLSFLIFKGPKNKELESLSADFKEKGSLKIEPIDKDIVHLEDKTQFSQMIRLHYNFPKLTSLNRPMIFSSKIVEFLSTRKIPAFFFMSAINHKLVDEFIENPNIFKMNMGLIGSIFKGDNIYYRNFNEVLSEEDFRDSDHLATRGNQDLAKIVALEILPILEKLLQEKRGSV
ncbi:MAG: hypothetical protein AB1472_01075 [Candidatus Omnitrophota bacterium]